MSLDPMKQELDLSVIEMVNRHSEQVRAQERQRNAENRVRQSNGAQRSAAPSRTHSRTTTPIKGTNRNLERDVFISSKGKRVQKKKSGAPIRAGAALTAMLTLCGLGLAKCQGPNSPSGDDVMPTTSIVQPYDDTETSNIPFYDDYQQHTSATPETVYGAANVIETSEIVSPSQKMLEELEATGGLAWENFDVLCNNFNLSREEMAKKLIYMCEAEEWADGCTTPTLLCAQIYHESYNIKDKVGDGGDAIGIGQFHKCAVDEVNRIYKTHYTYEDRKDPDKSLEMMALYLKHCYKQTGSRFGMMAMYNAGHEDAIKHQYGKDYVNHVLEKINESMTTYTGNYKD